MRRVREEKRRGEKRSEEKRSEEKRSEAKRSEEKRREEKRRKKIKKRKSQKKEDPGARKGRKVAKHSVFQMICGSRGSKSRFAKAAGAEPAGQMRDDKLHAVVARSTFRSQNVQNTTCSDHFWKLRCRKSARRCGAKHISKSKCTKHLSFGALFWSWDVEKVHAVVARSTFPSPNVQNTSASEHFFEVEMSKKVHAVVARSTFPSQNVQNTPGPEHFLTFRCRFAWQAQGIVHLVKSEQNVRVLWQFQKRSQAWDIEEDLQRCIFRGRCSTRDTFIRAVRSWGRWFPERDCILEHQIFRFAEMILRDRCSTSYDLVSLFRGRRSSLDRWSRKITKRNGTRPWALHSTFHLWRKSRRIASFLMLSSSKIQEVSQNCLVFDVVKFKNPGSLAELFSFWCCQVQKLRKSRWIASFWMLSSSKIEEVSQNSCVFKLADRQIDR